MPSIDQKIVQMIFDNKQFEEGVSQSTKSLDNLKKSLDLDKSARSLANIEKAAKGFDLSGISNGIEEISNKFSALGILGISVMQRISNAAIDAGINFAKSISIDQISTGKSKYETETKAVQTITNATGKSVEEVEKVLSTLMDYTDETSYDFSEMVNTIGKFTSVGVELEVAERAMEGIANEAAKSGAGVSEANRAMYNFAQALSSGSVRLQDWKSIEGANMATKEFKEQLIQTAIELGTLSKKDDNVGKIMKQTSKATKKSAAQFKETEVNFKSFNETLSEGWLTTEVLIGTLEKYANRETDFGLAAFKAAQEALTFTDAINAVKDAVSSGWSRTFKLLFGNLDESRVLWTKVANSMYDFVSIFFDARNNLLEGWHELGGYNTAVEAASNIWHTFMNVVNMVKDALADVFPQQTPEGLKKITDDIKSATDKIRLVLGYDNFKSEEKTFKKRIDYAQELSDAMQIGSEGDNVKTLQESLIKAGFHYLDKYGADGIYGPETEEAVKQLQIALGVDITGAWDEATRSAAIAQGVFVRIEDVTEDVETKIESTSNTMRNIQRVIKGVASGFKIVKSYIGAGLEVVKHFLSLFKPLATPLLALAALFGNFIDNFRKSLEATDAYGKIVDKAKKKLEPFGNLIKKIADSLTEFISRFERLAIRSNKYEYSFSGFFQYVGDELKKTDIGKKLFKIVDKVSPIIKKIAEFFKTLKDAFVGFFSADTSNFETFGEKLKERLKPFEDVWDWIKTNFNKLFTKGDADSAGQSVDLLGTVFEKIKGLVEFIKGINVAKLALFGVALYAAFKMYKRIKAPMDFVSNIAQIAQEVKKKLGNKNKQDWLEVIGEFAKNFGIGIALISASIYGLAQLDTNKALIATGIIIALAGVMVGVAALFKKFKLDGINSKGFLKFGALILILANSVVKLGSIPFENMLTGLLGLTVLMGEVIAFSKLMKGNKVQVGGLTDLGAGISMVVSSLKTLSELKTEDLVKGLIGIGAVLIELGVFMKLANGADIKSGPLKMVGIGLAIMMLSISLKSIAKLSWDEIGKGLVGLGAVMLELVAFMRLTSGFGSGQSLFGLVGIGAAVLLLAKSMTEIAQLNVKGILKGVIGIGLIMAEIAVFMKLVGGRSPGRQIALMMAMIGIGVAISSFANSLKTIGKLKTKSLIKGIVGLGAVMLEIAAFMKLIGGRNGLNMMGNAVGLMGIGVAINLFVLSLAGLSLIKPGGITRGLAALGALFLELAIFMKIVGNTQMSIKALPVLILTASSLLMFSLALAALGDIDWTKIIAFGASFGIVLTSIASSMTLLSKIPISGGLTAIANLDLFIANLVLVLTALGGLQELTNGGLGNWLEKGAQALGQAIGGFIKGIISPFIQNKPGLEKNNSLSDYLNTMVSEMSTVLDNMQPFLEKVKGIDEASVNGVGNFVAAILKMSGAELVDAMANWIVDDESGSAFVGFAKDLVLLAPHLVEFSNLAEGINVNGISVASSAMEQFAKLAEATIPMTAAGVLDAIGSFITGGLTGNSESPYVTFANNLVNLIPAMNNFASEANGVNTDGITKAGSAMEAFASVCSAAMGIGWDGFLSNIGDFITGQDNILSFADKMITLAPKLVTFGNNVKNVDNTSISAAAGSLEALAGVAEKIPGAGGVIQNIFGEHDIEDFGNKLGALGSGVYDFYNKTKDIPSDYSADGFASSLGALAQVAKDIPGAGGFIQAIVGDKSLENFGDDLKPLGEGLAAFATATQGIPKDYDSTGPVNALTAMSELESGLEAHGGITQWFSGEKDIGLFGQKLAELGSNLKNFFDDTKDIKTYKLKQIGNGLQSIVDAVVMTPDRDSLENNYGGLQYIVDLLANDLDLSGLITVGEKLAQNVSIGITNASKGENSPISALQDICDDMDSLIDGYYNTFESDGEYLDEGLMMGLYRGSGRVTAMTDRMVQAAYNMIGNHYYDFMSAGEYLDEGLMMGLYRGSSRVTAMARRVAQAAYYMACKELGINSPSKEGIWIGEMFDEGFAKGLSNSIALIERNSKDLGGTAVKSALYGVQTLANIIASDIDSAPVIRPVLDLSDVRNGAGELNSMLGNSGFLGLGNSTSSMQARSISMRQIQNSASMMQSSMDRSDSNLERLINDFSNKFDRLDADMKNLKVYLNGHTLVGEIMPDVNRGVGKATARDLRIR